jgi:hypothetical protein
VELLNGPDGFQIKELDKAIQLKEYPDICQEVQEELKYLFSDGKKRKPAEPANENLGLIATAVAAVEAEKHTESE